MKLNCFYIILGLIPTWLLIIALSQDHLIYRPRSYQSHGLSKYYSQSLRGFETASGYRTIHLEYNTSFGQQHSYLLVNGHCQELWIAFGGNAQLALDWISFLSKLTEPAFQKQCYLLFEYPGYGNSEGDTRGSVTTSESASIALELSLSRLETETRLKPKVAILGHSIGCAAGLSLDASKFEIYRYILVSPFRSIPILAQELLFPTIMLNEFTRAVLEVFTLHRNHWNNEMKIIQFNNQPKVRRLVSIFHGTEDSIVPFSHGKGLHELFLARSIESRFFPSFSDHNDIFEVDLLRIKKEMLEDFGKG